MIKYGNMNKISIIIPAYNEEKIIKATVEAFKAQSYRDKEVIVVVNNTVDATCEIAQKCADKVLEYKENIGVCAARNYGVEASTGDILFFVDADTRISKNTLSRIGEVTDDNIFGSTLGKGDNESIRGKLFFFFKNWTHRLGLYHGVVDGVLFCHKKLFDKTGGFDERLKIAEFKDFISKAKNAGGKYKLLTDCYSIVSLRRYEEKGYINVIFFWLVWKIKNIFKKDKKMSNEYFKKHE